MKILDWKNYMSINSTWHISCKNKNFHFILFCNLQLCSKTLYSWTGDFSDIFMDPLMSDPIFLNSKRKLVYLNSRLWHLIKIFMWRWPFSSHMCNTQVHHRRPTITITHQPLSQWRKSGRKVAGGWEYEWTLFSLNPLHLHMFVRDEELVGCFAPVSWAVCWETHF